VLVRERIRAVIKEKRTTQAAVARALSEPEYWVSDRLTGRVNLLAEELPAFAVALSVNVCDFFEDAPREQPTDFEPSRLIPPLGRQLQGIADERALSLGQLSPARLAIVQRVLQGLDEAGVE
jgi:transcriptional regulator with XRE-family HTH domain